MNPYPQDRSILVLDNCSIHKSELLREVIEGQRKSYYIILCCHLLAKLGNLLIFLPPYSPDFNPIEESFSAGSSCSKMSISIPNCLQ